MVCGYNVLLITTHCVFITRLISTLFVNRFVFTTKSDETRKNPKNLGKIRFVATEMSLVRYLEVLTTSHGYLIDNTFFFFNLLITGLTASLLVSSSTPIHFFSTNSLLLNFRSVPRPTAIHTHPDIHTLY